MDSNKNTVKQSISEANKSFGVAVNMIILDAMNETNNDVRIIEEHLMFEQPEWATYDETGTKGWTRQLGGGEWSWITGTATRYNIFTPWNWIWGFNYRHDFCEGQEGQGDGFDDPYLVLFMGHPNVRGRVMIMDY